MRQKTTQLIKKFKLTFFTLIALWATGANIAWATSAPPQPSLAPMLEEAVPAVVHIATVRHRPEGPGEGPAGGQGSGVIVDAQKGLVLTNWHVLNGADEVLVMLHDKRTFPAKILGGDPPTDVALLQIPAESLKAMPLGNSDKLNVGDYVLAIGNPFGLSQTVTSGIVSALGRSELGIEGYEDFIQTDASINPGNSGGALINLKGELVGINTAILGPNGTNVGLGFAIPISMAENIMQQLLTYGEVKRGLLGIAAQPLTPELAEALSVKGKQGALIAHVIPDSPAELAGVRPGDVVVALNDREIVSANELRNRLSLAGIETDVRLKLLRAGKPETLTIRVEDPREYRSRLARIHPALTGLELRPFEDVLPNHGKVKGLQIISLHDGAPAARFGLRPLDIITDVNQESVTSIEELSNVINKNSAAGLFRVVRGPSATFVVMK